VQYLRQFHSSIERDVLEHSAALEHVLERLRTTHLGLKAQCTNLERHAIKRARELLESNLEHALSLQDLASAVALSPYHLARAFEREVGLPPHAYRMQTRINRAKALLGQGMSAAEVALAVGFSSQSHLIAQFKRLTGVTPSKFTSARV
jgi:AraC-like DNA-binding protein